MQEKESGSSTLKSFARKYLADPVLIYSVIVMAAIMCHYRQQLVWLYSLTTFLIAFLLLRLFDFINKHRLVGALAYLAVGFMFFVAASLCVEKGTPGYNLPFAVWFITPQIAVEYNPWYTLATYLFFSFYMVSVIYYFTRIRYRVFMGFLVFIIPFAIYGKENETMPILYIMLMCASYILIMVYFRQMRNVDAGGEKIKVVAVSESWKSIGAFVAAFAIVGALVPKPTIPTDRSILESMISAERFTDKMVAMLSTFRDTSSGGQFRNVDDSTVLYFAEADEDLHLKTATFTSYDYFKDMWVSGDADRSVREEAEYFPTELDDPGELTKALLEAAKLDPDFAERYGLTELSARASVTIPEKKSFKAFVVLAGNKYVPTPEGVIGVESTSSEDNFEIMETGLVRSAKTFYRADSVTFEYMSDLFFIDEDNLAVINAFSGRDPLAPVKSAYDIIDDAFYDSDDRDRELELLEMKKALQSAENDIDSLDDYLDYGDSRQIRDLAQEITAGCDTDYEKAKAIEIYFFANDFKYDPKYVKSSGENVETFLFNTKRGVCVEYATAMVLLARAAGIPARYCEGFSMNDRMDEVEEGDYKGANYQITPQDGHAYPELYINGYGWKYFEPTIGDAVEEQHKRSLADTLTRTGIGLLAAVALVMAFIFAYPTLSHKFFLARSGRRSPEDVVTAITRRLAKLYDIPPTNSSYELAEKIKEESGADVFASAELFNAAVYGEKKIGREDKAKALEEYKAAYAARREAKKKRRAMKNKDLNGGTPS